MALFRFIGTEALIERGQLALRAEIHDALNDLKGDAIEKTPKLTGGLRGDYDVDGPHVSGSHIEGKVETSTTGEGGPAFFVHERTELQHPVGQAKFLEAALLENALSLVPKVAAAARRAY